MTEGREIEETLANPRRSRHPAMDRLWKAELRDAVFQVWHQGHEEVELDHEAIGIGREFWLVNELLNRERDEDLVRWIVTHAPATLGWTDEPRSLYWLLRGENLGEARAAYHRSLDSGPRTSRIDGGRSEGREEERKAQERKAELREQLEQARRR